jgi:hypothetical protein
MEEVRFENAKDNGLCFVIVSLLDFTFMSLKFLILVHIIKRKNQQNYLNYQCQKLKHLTAKEYMEKYRRKDLPGYEHLSEEN